VRRLALLAVAVVSGLAFLLLSISSPAQKKSYGWTARFAEYVAIPGAKRVGSDTCATCHSEVAGDFRHAFHAQQGVECEDCHGAGSLHVEGGGDVTKIISFRQRTPEAANGVCLSCHVQQEKVRNWLVGAHSSNGVRCTDCHQIHGQGVRAGSQARMAFETTTPGQAAAVESLVPESKVTFESREQSNENCLRCHQTQRAEMSLPYHHPLREAKMACIDCHDPHGGPAGNNLRASSVNQLCLGCHAQYRGPFAYQHPPVTENCLTCHTPHGSPNTNLLQVSEPALCLQCHAGHHNGAGLPLQDRCTDCHVSIHGTDVATGSGGSRFVDKGPFGVPGESQQQLQAPMAARAASPHPSVIPPAAGALAGGFATTLAGLLPQMQAFSGTPLGAASSSSSPLPPSVYSAFSITPGGYRFVDVTGYGGRVGEYDSLQQSEGGDLESAYVSVLNGLTVLSRANILTGNDYHVASQLTLGERLQIGFDIRSFVQQQDNYPFYADYIDNGAPFPGPPPPQPAPAAGLIFATRNIPQGSVFGLKRRFGNAYARLKLPNLPVHLFVKGDWQARDGTSQLAYLDESSFPNAIDPTTNTPQCNNCHFTSQFQPVNYTTRTVGGGAEVNLGPVDVTYEHDYSSFNDRLQFPTATFGDFFTPNECFVVLGNPNGPCAIPATPSGNYFLDIPAPNQSSSDVLRLNWIASPKLIFNGGVTYTRARDVLTRNPQNTFYSDAMVTWHPLERLRLTADYHQQNLVNDFVPFYSLYGNVSYHEHKAGLRVDYKLTKKLGVETHYERGGITRSNSFLWPQVYSVDNSDLLRVVPSSFSNTVGLALRYRPERYWSARAGYEWTGTHDPGFLIVPKSNNRIFADVSLFPLHWLVFTNDISILVQNAFAAIPLPNQPGDTPTSFPITPSPVVLPTTFPIAQPIQTGPGDFQRRSRFYSETADATLLFGPNWNLELGYSYQQDSLNTFMAIQNDSAAGYVIDEPFVPYKQLSQTYWAQLASKFFRKAGFTGRFTYNSARSGYRPDLNPADFALLGNATLNQQGGFDPVAFGLALQALQLGSTQVSQVIVPEWTGQSKVYYLLPYKFNAGLLFYYGSYRDVLNPNLNGVLRTFNVYIGRSW
jgi:predicted CXXCH cytochrome family protein